MNLRDLFFQEFQESHDLNQQKIYYPTWFSLQNAKRIKPLEMNQWEQRNVHTKVVWINLAQIVTEFETENKMSQNRNRQLQIWLRQHI